MFVPATITAAVDTPKADLIEPTAAVAALRKIMIVVPCYNEAARLDLNAFISFVDKHHDVSFVFVDDGSTDATPSVLEVIREARPDRISVLRLKANCGKAEAVRAGLMFATATAAEFVGYWDADLATPLDAIADFAKIAKRYDDIDVVFGSRRALLGHRIERTRMRRAVSRVCSTLARFAVRLRVGDTQCGAKLLRNTASVRKSISTPFSAGWLFDVELFSRISALSLNPKRAFFEMPLFEWHEVAGSKVSGGAIMRSAVQMVHLIARSRLGTFGHSASTAIGGGMPASVKVA